MAPKRSFKRGDRIIYVMGKFSARPGRRARDVRPTSSGEGYYYEIEKYWVVEAVRPDGLLLARTRRGKVHILNPSDRALQPAGWLQRWMLRSRFPQLSDSTGGGATVSPA